MTTFQDPPPQSRRSARQSERGEAPEAAADVTETSASPESASSADQAPAAAYEPFAPSAPPVAAVATDEQPLTRSGRRAREAAEQGLSFAPRTVDGEPLEYMTQGRDEPLSYQAPEPQLPPAPRPDAQAPVSAPAEPAPATADETAAPQFRVRDFSPEGRVTGRRAAAPPLIEPGSGPSAPPSDLEYRTEVGPTTVDIPADAAAPVPTPFTLPIALPVAEEKVEEQPIRAASTEVPDAERTHHTLTRRELRQRLADDSAASLETAPPPAPVADSALVTGPQPPAPDASLVTGTQPPAPAPDASLVTGTQPPAPDASLVTGTQPPAPDASLVTGTQPPAPTLSSIFSTGAQPPPPLIAPPAPPTMPTVVLPPASTSTNPGSDEARTTGEALADFEELSRSGQLAPPSASQRVGDSPVAHGPSFLEPMPEPELDVDLEHTGGWVPPVGHWSRQADLDDETQPWENTVTREVGGGNVATTTSALVLPEMPRSNPFPPALNATGEILLTGSIDLPRSLSSVGGDSRHFDDSDVDLMFDDKDREFSATDSSPVSAIRAVSTHTSARGVISTNKPHGNRMLTVLLVTAGVMAVGVLGLLIAGLAGQFF